MRKVKYYFIASFILILQLGRSQSLSDIKLNSLLCCNLHDVLMDISVKNNIRFLYDVEQISKIEINTRPIKKPVQWFIDRPGIDFNL